MKRVIITNNKKVEYNYSGKIEVIMLENASNLDVLREGLKVASEGGRLLMDPTRRKSYYKSLIFYMEGESGEPDERSIALLEKCIQDASQQGTGVIIKESMLSGILQSRDLSLVKSIC